jgi:periplasmic divalent cation tolerance protein
MSEHVICFVTSSNLEQATDIARFLVQHKLAACVNLIDPIRSIYRWKDEIYDEKEILMIIKTRRALFEKLTFEIKNLHSYETPEIICVPIDSGLPEYLAWIDENTTNAK